MQMVAAIAEIKFQLSPSLKKMNLQSKIKVKEDRLLAYLKQRLKSLNHKQLYQNS
jgi:hypothetical protein